MLVCLRIKICINSVKIEIIPNLFCLQKSAFPWTQFLGQIIFEVSQSKRTKLIAKLRNARIN